MKDLLTPPGIEEDFPTKNFKDLVYPRLRHPILESNQKDLLFCICHKLYMNKERLFQQQRAPSPLCSYAACQHQGLIQSVEHIFCTCYRVRGAWQWTRGKLMGVALRARAANCCDKHWIYQSYVSEKFEGSWMLVPAGQLRGVGGQGGGGNQQGAICWDCEGSTLCQGWGIKRKGSTSIEPSCHLTRIILSFNLNYLVITFNEQCDLFLSSSDLFEVE